MSTETPTATRRTVADLIARLGGIDPARILLDPPPGTATEDDLIRVNDRHETLCELIDGALVEKVMGVPEATLAAWIIRLLGHFVDPNHLGELIGADGPVRLMGGLIRMPDVSFIKRGKLPGGLVPMDPISNLAPDLAVEVLSPSNTRAEMQIKRKEYFLAGTTLVWEVDPRRRVVVVYTEPEEGTTLTEDDTLDGGEVLPGFQLPVRRIFERVPVVAAPKRGRKKPKA